MLRKGAVKCIVSMIVLTRIDIQLCICVLDLFRDSEGFSVFVLFSICCWCFFLPFLFEYQ